MKAYIFITAIWNRIDEELRFHHTIICADSVDEAYRFGGRYAKTAGWTPVEKDETANDYVIELQAE